MVTVSGAPSNGIGFIVLSGSPTITGLSPSSGYVGLAVTISGFGFGTPGGQNTVMFNGIPGGVLNWSNTSVTAIVPNNATTGPVVVTVSDGQTSNNVNFTVNGSSCN